MPFFNAGCLPPGVLGSGWMPGPPTLGPGPGAEGVDPSAQPGISLLGRGLGGRRAHAWPVPTSRGIFNAADQLRKFPEHSLMTASRCTVRS